MHPDDGFNLTPMAAGLRHRAAWVAVLVVSVAGCAAPPKTEPLLSRWQLGRGDWCSVASAFWIGPTLGRSRNEGYFKSDAEIGALVPVVGLWARHAGAAAAAGGMTWDENRERLRHPFNQNNYADTQATLQAAAETGAVAKARVQRISRELASGSFTNVSAIVGALKREALDVDQARELVRCWLRMTCRDHTLNYYLHAGNEAMLARLVKHGLLEPDEARAMAAQWIRTLPRLTPDFIDDARALGVIDADEARLLLEREWSVLHKSLAASNGKSAEPDGVYRLALQDGRAATKVNSGGKLSADDRLWSVPLANMPVLARGLPAIQRGMTQSQYEYENDLLPGDAGPNVAIMLAVHDETLPERSAPLERLPRWDQRTSAYYQRLIAQDRDQVKRILQVEKRDDVRWRELERHGFPGVHLEVGALTHTEACAVILQALAARPFTEQAFGLWDDALTLGGIKPDTFKALVAQRVCAIETRCLLDRQFDGTISDAAFGVRMAATQMLWDDAVAEASTLLNRDLEEAAP